MERPLFPAAPLRLALLCFSLLLALAGLALALLPGGGRGQQQPRGQLFGDQGGASSQAVRAGQLPGSLSESSTASSTPSPSPTLSLSSSASSTATGTPSGTGTPSPSGTPSGSPSPSTSPVFGTLQCAQAAGQLLNRTNAQVLERCLHAGGPQNRLPMGAALVHSALWQACPAGAAEATYWQYASSLQPSDVCYVLFSRSRAATEAVAAGWASAVPSNLWFVAPEGDPALRILGVPALAGLPSERWLSRVIPAINALPAAAACKWFFLGSDTTWVNPRALLHAVRGFPHDTIPTFQGFMWVDQGFTSQITATNGGTSLWSAAGWAAVAARLGTPACPDSAALGLPADELAVASCADTAGVLALDLHVYDGSGAMQGNGVPLEPGPPHGERLAWMAQAATRAGHWAWIDGMGAGFQAAIWEQYRALYGPWGRLPAGAGVPSPSPGAAAAAGAAGTASYYQASAAAAQPPCAQAATQALRGLLEAGRQGPTSAQPLPMELASEVVSGACAPGPGAAPGAGTARALEEHLCYLLREEPGGDGASARLFSMGWGWRTPHVLGGAGGPHRRLWLASSDSSLPSHTPALPPSASLLALLAAWAVLPETGHCDYLYLGSSTDWVNGDAMAAALRGLRPDVPVRVGGIVLHEAGGGPGAVDAPALGRQVLSRAGVAALVGEGGSPGRGSLAAGCSSSSEGGASWGDDLNLCAWLRGVVPVGDFHLDVVNWGPVDDWAFQLPHYLTGWALQVDQGYDRGFHILESYWSGVNGQCFNASQQWSRDAVALFFTNWGYPPPAEGTGVAGRGGRAAAGVGGGKGGGALRKAH